MMNNRIISQTYLVLLCFMLSILTLIVVGCTMTLSKVELEELTRADDIYDATEWRYMGSRDDFHYFTCTDVIYSSGYRYKILKDDLLVRNSFAFTKDSTKWVLVPWWGTPTKARLDGFEEEEIWTLDIDKLRKGQSRNLVIEGNPTTNPPPRGAEGGGGSEESNP